MAQDPESEEAGQDGLEMVPVYSSQTVDAEMESGVIRGLLESNGIPSIVVGATTIAPLGFEVQVPRARLQDAERLIAEAEAAGPQAAAEAEEEGRSR